MFFSALLLPICILFVTAAILQQEMELF
jgi:hypothetical protein